MKLPGNHTIIIILCAFILHTFWEFGQCLFYYDMWDLSFLKGTVWMWVAIFGDIMIVLGLWKTVTVIVPSIPFNSPSRKGYALLLAISFPASIFLEWIAIYLDLWQYTPAMPVVTIFNYEVGLSPVLQITFLPALSIYLANRFHTQPQS